MDRSAFVYVAMALLASVLMGNSDAMTMDQVRQAGKLMRNMCQPKSGVSMDILEAASNGQFAADDRNLKCYMKCILGKMQSLKNGKYIPDAAISMAKRMLPDGVGDRTGAAIDKCRVEWDKYEDACDASYAVTVCTYEADPEVFFLP
ncbi:hypothetical protein B7P43_G02244 [Cryptotermes secundus]|uniref:General odorant-binding protein 19a n=1 Tax=Cryptotermes secundus TaxID=105785 RepID=A0A2J7PNF1_9NEOP|nr:general odorant-binding protein 19a [Cryptotermes secundus]PNF17861.1 hypothetical protein B7P43_G02244 [Cryptotermes secundus]